VSQPYGFLSGPANELTSAGEALRDWVAGVVGGAEVVLGSPTTADAAIAVHLLGLTQRNGSAPLPRGLAARYLIAVDGSAAVPALQNLGDVVLAGLERGDLDLDLDGPDPTWWSAIGAAPRPSVVVTVPLRPPRPTERAPVVREPLVLRVAPTAGAS
jgi:hypothetical protein